MAGPQHGSCRAWWNIWNICVNRHVPGSLLTQKEVSCFPLANGSSRQGRCFSSDKNQTFSGAIIV